MTYIGHNLINLSNRAESRPTVIINTYSNGVCVVVPHIVIIKVQSKAL